MVKLLKSTIIGVIDDTLRKILYIQFYGWKEYLLGYVFIFIGIIRAILVQSSSKDSIKISIIHIHATCLDCV